MWRRTATRISALELFYLVDSNLSGINTSFSPNAISRFVAFGDLDGNSKFNYTEYCIVIPSLDPLLLQVFDMLDDDRNEDLSLGEVGLVLGHENSLVAEASLLGVNDLYPSHLLQLPFHSVPVVSRFIDMDINADATIAPHEIVLFMRRHFGVEATAEQIKQFVSELPPMNDGIFGLLELSDELEIKPLSVFAKFVDADTNGDGILDIPEQIANPMDLPKTVLGTDNLTFPDFAALMKKYELDPDVDGNGQLDVSELLRWIEIDLNGTNTTVSERTILQIIRDVDGNADDNLNRDEYSMAMAALDPLLLQVLDVLDTNGDELVSVKELQAVYGEGSLVATKAADFGVEHLGPVQMSQLPLDALPAVAIFSAMAGDDAKVTREEIKMYLTENYGMAAASDTQIDAFVSELPPTDDNIYGLTELFDALQPQKIVAFVHFVASDTNGNAKLDREEQQAVDLNSSAAALNDDGSLPFGQYHFLLKNNVGPVAVQEHMALDTDNNAMLNLTELLIKCTADLSGINTTCTEAIVKEVISFADSDGNGNLNAQESVLALSALNPRLLQIMDLFDTDNDNHLSLVELQEGYPEGSEVARQATELDMELLGLTDLLQLPMENSSVVQIFIEMDTYKIGLTNPTAPTIVATPTTVPTTQGQMDKSCPDDVWLVNHITLATPPSKRDGDIYHYYTDALRHTNGTHPGGWGMLMLQFPLVFRDVPWGLQDGPSRHVMMGIYGPRVLTQRADLGSDSEDYAQKMCVDDSRINKGNWFRDRQTQAYVEPNAAECAKTVQYPARIFPNAVCGSDVFTAAIRNGSKIVDCDTTFVDMWDVKAASSATTYDAIAQPFFDWKKNGALLGESFYQSNSTLEQVKFKFGGLSDVTVADVLERALDAVEESVYDECRDKNVFIIGTSMEKGAGIMAATDRAKGMGVRVHCVGLKYAEGQEPDCTVADMTGGVAREADFTEESRTNGADWKFKGASKYDDKGLRLQLSLFLGMAVERREAGVNSDRRRQDEEETQPNSSFMSEFPRGKPGDSKLTPTEIAQYVSEKHGVSPATDAQIEVLVTQLPPMNDGIFGLTELKDELVPQRLSVFAKFVEADTDGNGTLDANELLAIPVFVSAEDLGDDGSLSFSEFAALAMDSDSDARSVRDVSAEKSGCYVGRLKCWVFALIIICIILCLVLISAVIAVLIMRRSKRKGKEAEVSSRHGRRLSGDGGLYATAESKAGLFAADQF